MNDLSQSITNAMNENRIPACTMCILRGSEPVFTFAGGEAVSADTRFDLASVTKLFTVSAFFRLADAGKIGLDEPLCRYLPEFTGMREIRPFPEPLIAGAVRDVSREATAPVDAGKNTFRQILTHSSGLPAWLPLYRCADPAEIRETVLHTYFSYQPGSDVVYSDLGLILTGWALEACCGKRLDEIIREYVTGPLGLSSVGFLPTGGNIAPTDICHWRQYRLCGEVEDENCAALGGISGHAGLFGTAADLARLGAAYLPGSSFLSETSRSLAASLQMTSRDGLMARGIGFQHWGPDPDGFYAPMSRESFGHTGFTGTALWVDPVRNVSIALLTNEVYNGRYDRKIVDFRKTVFQKMIDSGTLV